MSLIKKGSFLTFDTLKQSKNKDVINFIIFMNITKESSTQEDEEISTRTL